MFKLVIYPCACAALVVAHGGFIVFHRATPPKFLLELKKGQTLRSPAPWGYANILLWVCRRSTSGQHGPKSTIYMLHIYSRDSGGFLFNCRKITVALLMRCVVLYRLTLQRFNLLIRFAKFRRIFFLMLVKQF